MAKLHSYHNPPIRELVYAKIFQIGLNIMPTQANQENIVDYNPCPAQADRFNPSYTSIEIKKVQLCGRMPNFIDHNMTNNLTKKKPESKRHSWSSVKSEYNKGFWLYTETINI